RLSSRRRNDHERNVELSPVETRPVPEHSRLFAKTLAVIRGDDHPGSLEEGTAIELVDQPAELLIEIGHAVVVGVASEIDLVLRRPVLAQGQPISEPGRLSVVPRLDPETMDALLRYLVGIVGVIVIQEREERPLGLTAFGEPVEKLPIDDRSLLPIG